MAVKTWLGSPLPDVQADPADTHTPARSSMITTASPSTPSKRQLIFPGRRLFMLPLIFAPGISRIRSTSLSRRRRVYSAAVVIFSQASRMATAMATMAAVFSVPGLRPRSWPPPNRNGSSVTPDRQ